MARNFSFLKILFFALMTSLIHDCRTKLFAAHQNGQAISLKLSGKDKTMVVAIKYFVGDTSIVLEPLSLYGEKVDEPNIKLSQIERFVVFDILYNEHPYPYLREIKNNVKAIREHVSLVRAKHNVRVHDGHSLYPATEGDSIRESMG